MHVKDFRAKVKATGGDSDELEDGQYRALVSVFGVEDSVGDIVMPGAFKKSLADWNAKGDPIPIVWSHDWSDPFSHIGHVVKAEETDDGLVITGQLDLENKKAHQVYRLLKGRRVTQHSFAYDVQDGALAERDGRDVYELRELKVHEVGPCLLGANQATELIAAKARSVAATMRHGVKTDIESIRAAYDTLGDLLSEAEKSQEDTETSESDEDPEEEDETGQGSDETAADDAQESKSAAQPPVTPAQVLASITIQRLTEEHHAHAG